MSRVIKLTESQFRQIVGIKENINNKDNDSELEKAIQLYNKRPDLLFGYLTDFGIKYLINNKNLSIQDAEDVVQEKITQLWLDPKFKDVIDKGKDDVKAYYTARLNNAGNDVHRNTQKYQKTTTAFDDTFGVDDNGDMDNDIDSETSFIPMDTNTSVSEDDKYILFLLDKDESPLVKLTNKLGFVFIYYYIIKNDNNNNEKGTKKYIINLMKEYIKGNPENQAENNIIKYYNKCDYINNDNIIQGIHNIFGYKTKIENLPENEQDKKLQSNLMKMNSDIFGTGQRTQKKVGAGDKSSVHVQTQGLLYKQLFELYNEYIDIPDGLKSSEYKDKKNALLTPSIDISGRGTINTLLKNVKISIQNEYNNNTELQNQYPDINTLIKIQQSEVLKELETKYNIDRRGIILGTNQPIDKKKLLLIKSELEDKYAPYRKAYVTEQRINEVIHQVLKQYLQ